MKTIGIFANREKPSAERVIAGLHKQAKILNIELVEFGGSSRKKVEADILLVLGGDGTMLKAVRMLRGGRTPLLGVNLGNLGFLTSVLEQDIGKALQCLVSGDFTVHERALAECVVERAGKEKGRYLALNDVVIMRGASARIITLNIFIDEAEVLSCRGDGVIISTPTGSTGHSLSAGGPILHPESAVFVVSLICPHTLSARPLVVPDQKRISIVVPEGSRELPFSVDGQTGDLLSAGDRLEVCRSIHMAHFIQLPGYAYFSVLRHKLHWRGSTN